MSYCFSIKKQGKDLVSLIISLEIEKELGLALLTTLEEQYDILEVEYNTRQKTTFTIVFSVEILKTPVDKSVFKKTIGYYNEIVKNIEDLKQKATQKPQ